MYLLRPGDGHVLLSEERKKKAIPFLSFLLCMTDFAIENICSNNTEQSE